MGKLKGKIGDPKKWLNRKITTTPENGSISDPKIRQAARIGETLKSSIDEWFDDTYKHTVSQKEIETLFDDFQKKFTRDIPNKIADPKPSVFTSGLTPKLSVGNTFTRSLSTTLGEVFEDIACLSPKVISPNKHFDTKITGVDVLIVDKNTKEIIFSQMKTTRGTLTGSQRSRSELELSVFRKGIFSAVLDIGNWTFNSQIVERKCGSEFWGLVGINEYDFIKQKGVKMFEELEDLFKSFL